MTTQPHTHAQAQQQGAPATPLVMLHRIAAMVTLAGAYMFALWIIAIVSGSRVFAYYSSFQQAWVGGLLLWLWVFSMFFHLLTGWRHLLGNMTKGIHLSTTKRSTYVIALISFLLTSAMWFSTLGL